MGEVRMKEVPLMSEDAFRNYLEENRVDYIKEFYENNILFLRTFIATGKYKSVRRAIRRGLVSIDGIIFPKRPFNNRGKEDNILKKKIYERIKHKKVG